MTGLKHKQYLLIFLILAICSCPSLFCQDILQPEIQVIDYREQALTCNYSDGSFDSFDMVTILFLNKGIKRSFYIDVSNTSTGMRDFLKSVGRRFKISIERDNWEEILKAGETDQLFIDLLGNLPETDK